MFALGLAALALPPALHAQGGDDPVVDAREAFRKKDRPRLAYDRVQALAAAHPLAQWADYWELTNRLPEAQQDELNAFYARWPGSYVEDRLRNDWLLELGKRRDWKNIAAEYPRFRMNDDREVSCYALIVDAVAGKDVRAAALAAWLAQKEADDGCALLATTLYDAKQLTPADAWRKARLAMDANKPRAVRHAALLASPESAAALGELLDSPARFLSRRSAGVGRVQAELATLALTRLAATDTDAAIAQLGDHWEPSLPADLRAWCWAMVARQAAQNLRPDAADHYLRVARLDNRNSARDGRDIELPDDILAWKVRAALRADSGRARWQQVIQAVNAMSPAEQRDPAWVYWKARALLALAKDSQEGAALRALGLEQMASIAGQLHFYGLLAADDLGQPFVLPAPPAPLTDEERGGAAAHPGLTRAVQLIALGLRNEGVREWNFALRGMGERELLAAAQLACAREIWDRCINTSERTRGEVDMAQRFPTPYRQEVQARAGEIGLDPAYVYGLIRQESRFILDTRSSVGASGLMQLMPATARWTAKKIGLDPASLQLNDRDTNIVLGTNYLKLVLDDFGGSQTLATAAYNAGPARSRKWREGPLLEPAVWAENIPFGETRDYVKKVLSNASLYAAHLGGPANTLKARLGRAVGPREGPAPALDKDLP